MEFKIDEEGILYIKRGSKWQKQQCPYTSLPDEDLMACGHWCPLFDEPTLREDFYRPGYGWVAEPDGQVKLSLCQRTLEGYLTDEREGGRDPVAAMEQWQIAKAEGEAKKAQEDDERPRGAEGETQ